MFVQVDNITKIGYAANLSELINYYNESENVSKFTDDEISTLNRLSNLNMLYTYREEIDRIRKGYNPRDLLPESVCKKLLEAGAIEYPRSGQTAGKWIINDDWLKAIET